jgi:hypothetical protein
MSYQPSKYETVAAGSADQVMGTTGAVGDWLESLILTVSAAATSTVEIDDGTAAGAIPVLAANTPIGVYVVKLQLRSRVGGWRVTTGAGVSAIATGDFS